MTVQQRGASLVLTITCAGLIAGVSLLTSGCGLMVTGRAWLSKEEFRPTTEKVIVGSVKQEDIAGYANRFALMALFAKTVYRRDLPESTRNETGCDYVDGKTAVPDVGMPRSADGTGWRRWTGVQGVKPCVNQDGLSFETYVHDRGNGVIEEAVVAYRGTENFSVSDALNDWATNLSAAMAVEPRQYVAAQGYLKALLSALKKVSPNVRIYATGHSLGGGLAQQAGYLSADIREVFAFDPSPVTNWSFLQSRKEIGNSDPVIHRIYHWHEGLAYVRNVTSRFNSRRLGRADYEFYFQDVKPIAAHEMGILACHLAMHLKEPMGEHGYPREFARKVVHPDYGKETPGQEHPICPHPAVNLGSPTTTAEAS